MAVCRYSLILRLVVIVLLIPADTSECERIFSLMNNIKTSERSRLGVNLKHLMLWHHMACKQNEDGTLSGKHIACCEVPVMEIIKVWRSLAGPKGRYAHRPAPVPSYEYEKGRTEVAKADKLKAEKCRASSAGCASV